jgi:3-hydroxymyristoyl/3-hydroxydecanoyl-(acyl carrier protein) dehydratase
MAAVSDLGLDPEMRSLTCLLTIPHDLAIFRGHFPGMALVPGVIQVAWVIELAHSQGLAGGPLIEISAAKFRRIVRPGMCLKATVARGASTGQLQFTFDSGGTIVSTGRLRLAP